MLVDTPQIVWHGGEAGKNAPVLSLDSHPLPVRRTREDGRVGVSFVLATAGTDAEVRLWTVTQPTEDEEGSWDQPEVSGRLQSFVASLEGHQRGVNVVRFSPDGLSLASASDGGTVVIWSVSEVAAWITLKSDRETQKVILRGATEDIYDLTWSPDSKYIACGSIDRRAHVWEVATKRSIATLEDHANYVQGTAWDPLSKYMATQSSDRSCRVYQLAQSIQDGGSGTSGLGRLTVKCCNVIKSCIIAPDDGGAGTEASRVHQGVSPSQDVPEGEGTVAVGQETTRAPTTSTQTESDGSKVISVALTGGSSEANGAGDDAGAGLEGKGCRGDEHASATDADSAKDKSKPVQRKNLFVDETVTSFFRRLSWSPDGAFLITPTAQNWDASTRKTQFCTYLFTRGQFVKPAVCLPGLNKPSVAVRCNPRLFALKGSADTEVYEAPVCDLPYRAVFAVVSLDAVVVYDTEHSHPLTMATGLHYSGLTDACWSSDGLSLFVSSTDGYVSTIHFKPGELGVPIPESDVPLQTRRLHPVIYGWQPEATHADELQVSIPSSSPSAGNRCGQPEHQGAMPRADEGVRTAVPEGAQATVPNPDLVPAKPKKKIVPTLVSPFPSATSLAAEQPPHLVNAATPLSPTPPADDPPGERKKRRIAPTLVHSDIVATNVQATRKGVVSAGTEDVSRKSSPIGDGASKCTPSTTNPEPGSGQQDRTPKKKRLAPTLVSAL